MSTLLNGVRVSEATEQHTVDDMAACSYWRRNVFSLNTS